MKKNNKSFLENLFYNNKFLMVFCVLISIIVWTTVKINYSADTVRTVSDVKINISGLSSDNSDFKVFVDESELYADVEVTGKAYNINSNALSKDDIVIEATGSYSDSAGYRVLTLTAKVSDASDASGVTITSVTPSTITVYYDKQATATFDVEARLTNDLDTLVDEDYTVGQPVPSVSTVDVTGPVTIINKLSKVYFDATVVESELPLTISKVLSAEISFELEKQAYAKYLTCDDINAESNPATVTVPVYTYESVPTQVKFINQPSYYSENPLEVKVDPSEVKITYNSVENTSYDSVSVGTVDFRELTNGVNTFSFEVDSTLPIALSEEISEFKVTIDLSDMHKKTLSVNNSKIILSNQQKGVSYTVDVEKSGLDSIVVIGPKESIDKITSDDIQIEINVSSLGGTSKKTQSLDVTNISIINNEASDCWIYGKYKAIVTVSSQEKS